MRVGKWKKSVRARGQGERERERERERESIERDVYIHREVKNLWGLYALTALCFMH